LQTNVPTFLKGLGSEELWEEFIIMQEGIFFFDYFKRFLFAEVK